MLVFIVATVSPLEFLTVTLPPHAHVPMEIFTGPVTATSALKLFQPCSLEWNLPESVATDAVAPFSTLLTVPSSATAIPNSKAVLFVVSSGVSRLPLVRSTLKAFTEPSAAKPTMAVSSNRIISPAFFVKLLILF